MDYARYGDFSNSTPAIALRGYSGFNIAESVALKFHSEVIRDNRDRRSFSLNCSKQEEFVLFMSKFKNIPFNFNKKTEKISELTASIWKKTQKEIPITGDLKDWMQSSEGNVAEKNFFFTNRQGEFLRQAELKLPPEKKKKKSEEMDANS
jgi:hypothetical protein